MTSPFFEENRASREKLAALLNGLSDADLALTTDYGWTVAALLAHMAWWDQRVLVLLRRWKEHGIDESPADSQLINDALKPLCHALAPRAALQLCLPAAAETDAEVTSTPPELIAEIETGPTHFRFNRALHRYDHIGDIEALIGASER
ncbi:MAG: maleylpyruvate isomerase N-terminal domain-containing protein [Caldilineaceae bacterium]